MQNVSKQICLEDVKAPFKFSAPATSNNTQSPENFHNLQNHLNLQKKTPPNKKTKTILILNAWIIAIFGGKKPSDWINCNEFKVMIAFKIILYDLKIIPKSGISQYKKCFLASINPRKNYRDFSFKKRTKLCRLAQTQNKH